MRVLIIGAGRVGTKAASLFLQAGHTLTLTTTTPSRLHELNKLGGKAVVYENSVQELQDLLHESDIVVITTAAKNGSLSAYENAYLKLACHIKELLPQQVRQVIYTSSTSLYGDAGGAIVTEETPPSLQNDHSRLLHLAEQTYLSTQTPSRSVCILRLAELFGPGHDWKERMLALSQHPQVGDGSNYCNFTHVEDAARGILFASENHLQGIFNLCNTLHPTRKELYTALCKFYELPPISWTGEGASPRGNKRVSNAKLSHLGFCCKHEITGHAFDCLFPLS